MKLKNTCLLVLIILLGASLAQAQTATKPKVTQLSKNTQPKWMLQSSRSGRVYPANKPVPLRDSPYAIINQNNPNEQVTNTQQLAFVNGQATNRTRRRDNFVSRHYFMRAGDGVNVKVLTVKNTQTNQVRTLKKHCVFNVMFK
jgi:hypothetical protein